MIKNIIKCTDAPKAKNIRMYIVPIDSVVEGDIRTTKMDRGRFDLLVENIREAGFLQPILVTDGSNGKLKIVDGHHRWEAAKNLGLKTIPVMAATFEKGWDVLETLSMQNLRGIVPTEVSLSILQELGKEGFSLEDLSKGGYTLGELTSLMELTANDDNVNLLENETDRKLDAEGEGGSWSDRRFPVSLSFSDSDEAEVVREAFKRAGGGKVSRGALILAADYLDKKGD